MTDWIKIDDPERPAPAAKMVIQAAGDLVALWRAQKISGASRSDRNAAIEEVRERLCRAVDALGEVEDGSPQ